jgi:periplasmic divalent cation tolerance protein
MENIVLFLTTVPQGFDHASLARTLVADGHAACVSVYPLHESTYRWDAVIETAREHQVVIKTTSGRTAAVEAVVRAVHPYQVPEVLIVPVEGGGADYLAWVRAGGRE